MEVSFGTKREFSSCSTGIENLDLERCIYTLLDKQIQVREKGSERYCIVKIEEATGQNFSTLMIYRVFANMDPGRSRLAPGILCDFLR